MTPHTINFNVAFSTECLHKWHGKGRSNINFICDFNSLTRIRIYVKNYISWFMWRMDLFMGCSFPVIIMRVWFFICHIFIILHFLQTLNILFSVFCIKTECRSSSTRRTCVMLMFEKYRGFRGSLIESFFRQFYKFLA